MVENRDAGSFITIDEYRRKVLGKTVDDNQFSDKFAVTLEISALQYFPWLIEIAKRSIDDGLLMPGRYIKVRNMKEQEAEILKVPVELELKVWFGDKRKRDLQNCFDTVCDSLENIVYTDDSQIRKLTGYKYYEKNIWKFEILIRPLSEDTKTAGEET